MIDGTSQKAFERSVGAALRGMNPRERRRFVRAVANLLGSAREATGTYEGIELRLHGMTIEEVLTQGEAAEKALGPPLVEGEMDDAHYTLHERGPEDSDPEDRGLDHS